MTTTTTTRPLSSRSNSKTLLGSALLGTWTAQTELQNHETGDAVMAHFVVHFMADPRRGRGCNLEKCSEIDNHVCMIASSEANGRYYKQCRDIAKEMDVNWSDVVAFFNFGLHIHAVSTKPKAQHLELTTGDWIGPFNVLLAANEGHGNNASSNPNHRHSARYVMSQSLTPPYFQNQIPSHSSLYTRSDVFDAVMGSSALRHMIQTQANVSFHDNQDPYEAFRQTCDHGSVQPLLPQWEWDLVPFSYNRTQNDTNNFTCPCDNEELQLSVKFGYKLMVIPHPSELAYRILPQLQPIFQAKGSDGYNLLSGPYCYDNDPFRAYSLDFQWDSNNNHDSSTQQNSPRQRMALVKGCVEGYPCLPPAAMGSASSSNHTVEHFNQSCFVDPFAYPNAVDVGRLLLMFGCYGLGIALIIAITYNCHLSYRQKQIMKKAREREEQLLLTDQWEFVGGKWAFVGDKRRSRSIGHDDDFKDYPVNSPPSPYFGKMSLLNGGGLASITNHHHSTQDETVGPFGDLEHATKDLLSQPLLEHPHSEQQQQQQQLTQQEEKQK